MRRGSKLAFPLHFASIHRTSHHVLHATTDRQRARGTGFRSGLLQQRVGLAGADCLHYAGVQLRHQGAWLHDGAADPAPKGRRTPRGGGGGVVDGRQHDVGRRRGRRSGRRGWGGATERRDRRRQLAH